LDMGTMTIKQFALLIVCIGIVVGLTLVTY
jgi:hypothetical protein